jgi:hypothetical protein
MKLGGPGMRQDTIDTAAKRHITAKKHAGDLSHPNHPSQITLPVTAVTSVDLAQYTAAENGTD